MTSIPEDIEDFGADPDGFDIDAWIDQGARPRREVTVYRSWDLLAEYERLVKQLDEDAAADDESMGDVGIREQIEDVIARMEASRLVFTVQALTGEELKELAEKAPTKPILDDDGKQMLGTDGKPRKRVDQVTLGDMTAAAAVIKVTDGATGKSKSTISEKQLRKLRVTLGDGPTYGLYRAVTELAQAGQLIPSVPSSREH
ncbi:hypothetical protein PQI65_14990 [Brachybacterium paraconglomeratum]